MKPAAAAMPTAPARSMKVRFFIIFTPASPHKGRDGLLLPLDGDGGALFLNKYHSLPAHGMPLLENV
jgi:hypothetical protein